MGYNSCYIHEMFYILYGLVAWKDTPKMLHAYNTNLIFIATCKYRNVNYELFNMGDGLRIQLENSWLIGDVKSKLSQGFEISPQIY